jgi:uncharacterized membrane protein
MDLLAVSLGSLLLIPVAMFTSGPMRIGLGLAFVLFMPGYALIAALFPRRGDLGGIERLALSFGLSLAVVPLVGLALNYTPWGIRFSPILFSLAFFILAMAAVAYHRRRSLVSQERYEPRFRIDLSGLRRGWGSQGRWDRVLSLLLILAILGAMGSLGYVVTKPKVGESFTEFYVLGLEGKAEGYPRQVLLGDEARVRLGLVNNEHEAIVYRVVIAIDGEETKEIGPIEVVDQQRWEEEVGFRPAKLGERQKVEFLLYKGRDVKLYRSLHLWVDVGGG